MATKSPKKVPAFKTGFELPIREWMSRRLVRMIKRYNGELEKRGKKC
jgi:hypothetical protein